MNVETREVGSAVNHVVWERELAVPHESLQLDHVGVLFGRNRSLQL